MNKSSMISSSDKAFASANKSIMDGKIISGSLNAIHNVTGTSIHHNAGMSTREQTDILKSWYSPESGAVANFRA